MIFRLFLLLILVAAAELSAQPADIKSDRIFVKFREHVQPRMGASDKITSLEPAFSAANKHRLRGAHSLDRIYIAEIPAGSDPVDVAAGLNDDPSVEYAEPVPVYRTQTLPDDPKFVEGKQNYLHLINAPEAWDITTGSDEVIIAIIDTGTDLDHVDLADNTWINPNEQNDGTDNSGSGKVDDVYGWDFWSDDNDPRPESDSHGTHVAGIAAAVTDNGEGIASLGHSVSFMPLKVSDGKGGNISSRAAYNAMLYAAEQGASIINCSWGSTTFSQTAAEVVSEVYRKGAVIVAAAGNEGTDREYYPAAYPEVMAVASVNGDKRRSEFSNYGSYISVAAPGENIYSTLLDNSYGPSSGTSMAAPVVSALAGLIASQYPDMSNDQIRAQIKASAAGIDEHPSDQWYQQLGVGLIDAAAALSEPEAFLHASDFNYTVPGGTSPPSFEAASGFKLHVDWHNLGIALDGTEVYFETFAPGVPEDDSRHDAVVPPSSAILLGDFKPGEIKSGTPVEFSITGQAAGHHDQRIIIQAVVSKNGQQIASPVFDLTLNAGMVEMNAGTINVTLGSGGRIGRQDYPEFETGSAFIISSFGSQEVDERWADKPLLREGGLMFTNDPDSDATRVSNSIRRSVDFADDHFIVREPFRIEEDQQAGFQQSTVSFTDGGADEPYDVVTRLTAKSMSGEDTNRFILLNYRFTNESETHLDHFQPGLFLDWVLPLDVSDHSQLQRLNNGAVNTQDDIAYVAEWDKDQPLYAGATTFEPLEIAYLINNRDDTGIFGIEEKFETRDKALTLSYGIRTPGELSEPEDLSMVVGPPALSLAPGESRQATWILGWGIGYDDLRENLQSGREYASEIFTSSRVDHLPALSDKPTITQVYPNPFNAVSTVEFQITEHGHYDIDLVNLLGQNVLNLKSTELEQGRHSITLDAGHLATGVYRVLLRHEGKMVDSKGITLIK